MDTQTQPKNLLKIKSFQYEILQRVFTTNHFLNMCKIEEGDKCSYCNVESEDIEHLFWDCALVNNLWIQFGDSLSDYVRLKDSDQSLKYELIYRNTSEC